MKARDFLNRLEHDAIVKTIGEVEAKMRGEIRVFISRKGPEDAVAAAQRYSTILECKRPRKKTAFCCSSLRAPGNSPSLVIAAFMRVVALSFGKKSHRKCHFILAGVNLPRGLFMAFGALENFWRTIFPAIRAIKSKRPATSHTINLQRVKDGAVKALDPVRSQQIPVRNHLRRWRRRGGSAQSADRDRGAAGVRAAGDSDDGSSERGR